MSVRDLIMKGQEEGLTIGVGALAGALISVLLFLFYRSINRGDHDKDQMYDSVNGLRETVGQLKMVNDAQWRQIDELKADFKTLREKFYEVKR